MESPLPVAASARAPSREVHVGDGVAWLRGASLAPEAAVFTSLPDASDVRGPDRDGWPAWFVDTVALVCARVASASVAVFLQTDERVEGRWLDKGHLVALGAARAGSPCRFHRVVCRGAPGSTTRGRPGYAHLLAFSRERELPEGPDVLPALGEMASARATGTAVCEEVVRLLAAHAGVGCVVDPFCGDGTVLAVANAFGLDAIGVEAVEARARRARELRFLPGIGLR